MKYRPWQTPFSNLLVPFSQLHVYDPTMLLQTDLFPQGLKLHSFISLQFIPSPLNPSLQLQLNDPGEFAHTEFTSHSSLKHSLISVQNPLSLRS